MEFMVSQKIKIKIKVYQLKLFSNSVDDILQKSAARLSKVEEARTLLAASSTATLSTISQVCSEDYNLIPKQSFYVSLVD